MILQEGAVCAAMKRDVKAGGYTAFGMTLEGCVWIGVKGQGWMALAEAGCMPRKVLGLIVEHAGEVPRTGDAWRLEKPRQGEIQRQDVMFGMIKEEALELVQGPWERLGLARMPLTLDGYSLWQHRADLRIVRVDPALEELAWWDGAADYDGGWLAAAGRSSRCFIRRQLENGEHEAWLKHLAQMSWIG